MSVREAAQGKKALAISMRRAFDAGPTPATPLSLACRCVLQLFDTPDSPGIAAERFAALRQTPRRSIDDFATELTRLASAAFPNLPPPDRDDLILHRFVSGLLDHTINDYFLLHPPRTLNDALRQCRYISHTIAPTNPIRDPRYPQLAQSPRSQIDGTPCLSVSLITTLAASTTQTSDLEHATAATTHHALVDTGANVSLATVHKLPNHLRDTDLVMC
nr:unnamed protein product [Spirometra erinaceieuropaei]